MASGRFKDALHALKRLFTLENTEELNYISYGMEFFNNGHYAYAIEVYKEAICNTNDNEDIQFFNDKIEEATQEIKNDSISTTNNISEDECETISFLLDYNNLNEIKKRIEQNSNIVHCTDRMGRTLLMYAVIRANLDIVQYLIDKGSNVCAIDNNSW